MERRKAQAEHDQAVAKAGSDVDVRYSVAAERVAEAEYRKADESNRKVPGSVTEVERDRLRLNEQKGELQIEQAQLERKMSELAAISKGVEVEAAEHSIERRLVKSPLDGVVVQLFPHAGEWMQPGDPLAHVVRTDKLRVEGFVDGQQWNADDVRDRPVTAEVTMAGGKAEAFTGRIVFTSPVVQAGNTFRVVAEVENRKSEASKRWLLRAGQTATMTIRSEQQPLPPVNKIADKSARSSRPVSSHGHRRRLPLEHHAACRPAAAGRSPDHAAGLPGPGLVGGERPDLAPVFPVSPRGIRDPRDAR